MNELKQSTPKKYMTMAVEPSLSPPWQEQYAKLKNTVGMDPLVRVGPLLPSGSNYVVRVRVMGNVKARALSTLLRKSVQFGNVGFKVVVVNQNGVTVSPFQGPFTVLRIVRILTLAFQSNRLFRFAKAGSLSNVYPVFAKQVVQFYDDNLGVRLMK